MSGWKYKRIVGRKVKSREIKKNSVEKDEHINKRKMNEAERSNKDFIIQEGSKIFTYLFRLLRVKRIPKLFKS